MTIGSCSLIGTRVVERARGWLGTPYHHQASTIGVGTDCLGLVRGVYRDVMQRDPEAPPAYTRDWGDADGQETLLAAAARHLEPVALSDARPGDVLIFRMRPRAVAKHAAILTGPATMIHAMEGAAVCEVAVCRWWRRRIVAVFRFPEIED